MNWQVFSTIGYASVAVWACMPVLWLMHKFIRPRRWLCHLAIVVGVVALVLAKINSQTHVNRIQVDRRAQIAEKMEQQDKARQAARDDRANDAAQKQFAEDSGDDSLDLAGLDESALKYLNSFDETDTPDWKKQKKKRSTTTDDDGSLESLIGATEEKEGVEADELIEEEPIEPIWMSDADKLTANRLDAANLKTIRFLLCFGFFVVGVDYLQRANVYREAYFPLPLPSKWLDAFTPRVPVIARAKRPRRSVKKELKVILQRGDSYLYVTDKKDANTQPLSRKHRVLGCFSPVDILRVQEGDPLMDDDFVFETLWFGRSCFTLDSTERAEQMLDRFTVLLSERRVLRAKASQAVHVVWDVDTPISDEIRHRFETLGRETGVCLFLCRAEA